MANLKVTAYLLAGFAAFDDWSPDLAGLIEWLILDEKGIAVPNPTPEDVERSRLIVDQVMPLEQMEVAGHWYWATSSPVYTYASEYTAKFRKRWTPGTDTPMPAWGKRKAKWTGSEGAEKNYDLPAYVRVTDQVSWYCRGDRYAVAHILQGCTGIGKKRSHGHGQIVRWEVVEVQEDWHLFGKDQVLMRPIPAEALPTDMPIDFAVRDWGWRPPAWLPTNKTRCAMPVHTVKKLAGVK